MAYFFYKIDWYALPVSAFLLFATLGLSLFSLRFIWHVIEQQNSAVNILGEYKSHWERICQSLPYVMLEISEDGIILQTSPRVFGLEGEKTIGKFFYDLLDDVQAKNLKNLLEKARLEGGTQKVDVFFLQNTGPECWRLTLQKSQTSQSSAFVLLGVDSTQRHETEMQMTQLVDLMEKSEQQIIYQVQHMLEPTFILCKNIVVEANDAAVQVFECSQKSDLIGLNIDILLNWQEGSQLKASLKRSKSHERKVLLTPLIFKGEQAEYIVLQKVEGVAISSIFVQDILQGLFNQMQAPILTFSRFMENLSREDDRENSVKGIAHRSIQSLATVMDDFSHFWELKAPKEEGLSCCTANLESTLFEVIPIFAMTAWSKKVELIFDLQDSIPEKLSYDAKNLRQVFVAILHNSTYFTDQGHIVIRVTKSEYRDGAVPIHIEVEDIGMMSLEDRQKGMFGEGLERCDKLVKKMHGTFSASFEKGARFSIKLDMPIVEETAVGRISPALENVRLILGCDNSVKKEILSRMLDNTSISYDVLENTDAVITQVEEFKVLGHYGVVLIDEHAKNIDSFKIQKSLQGQDVDIILLSNAYQILESDLEDISPFSEVIAQPFYASQILSVLDDILCRSGVEKSEVVEEGDERFLEEEKFEPRILLAEDIKSNQKAACLLLKSLGIEHVTVAWNGAEALELTQEKPFDLILMDVQMPRLDGFQATEEIKALQKSGKIGAAPIIAITPNTEPEEKEKCLASGMDAILHKPLKIQEVKPILSQFVSLE